MSTEKQELKRGHRWAAFLRKFLPESIIDVFPPNVLEDLLRGFLLQMRRGVTLLYADRQKGLWVFEENNRMEPFSIVQEVNEELLNPICLELRRSSEIQGFCHSCDLAHARNFSASPEDGPHIYSCWLGFIDLLYPIRLENEVIAFVFTGQILPDKPAELDKIKNRLTTLNKSKGDELLHILDQLTQRRASSGVTANQEIEKTQLQLKNFVSALETIMNVLYKAGKQTAEEDLLSSWAANLPAVDHTEELEWWRRVAQLSEDFVSRLGMGRVRLFVRAGKNFDQSWPNIDGSSNQKPIRLTTREVLQAVEPEVLIQNNTVETRQLLEKIVPGYGDACFYRTRTTSADVQPGLLFIFEGRPLTGFAEIAKQFLSRISSRTEYAALTFQLKKMYLKYVQTVSDAAHDFRHPLQLLEFHIAELMALPLIKQDQARIDELDKVKLRLRQAQEQTLSLQKQEKDAREVLNLVELLEEVIEFMIPRANAHPCPITRHGNWPDSVQIRANRGEMFRVFLNLIDNAIKYSFMGNQYDVRIQVFPIDWKVSNGIKVTLRNFGVGIPSDQLARICDRGIRAEVPDNRLSREGTGIGLSIVSRFLSEHGGTFEIDSQPESEEFNTSLQRRTKVNALGLRYATTVTVRLRQYKN